MTDLHLTVTDIKAETAAIACFRLAPADGIALPGFAAGAHITIAIPGVGPRKYSLVHADPVTGECRRTHVLRHRRTPRSGGRRRFALHARAEGRPIAAGVAAAE